MTHQPRAPLSAATRRKITILQMLSQYMHKKRPFMGVFYINQVCKVASRASFASE